VKNNITPDNFGGLSRRHSNYKNSAIVILPVPFDKTTTWIKGSSKGPQAIMNASKHLELYDIETGSEVSVNGIHTACKVSGLTPEVMVRNVYKKTRKFLADNKYTVVIGGEHTVSLGSIKAHIECFDKVSILHLDAHSDMRDTYEGTTYSHACVMARVKEMTDRIVSVGIRSMDASELEHINNKNIFYAADIRKSKSWINNAAKKLSDNVYITIDLDVFDPSIMPSTGTPEPGGLGWYEVVDLLEHVSKKKNIIGFDVVELCPSKNIAPDFLAAKLIYKLLSLRFSRFPMNSKA
jgi:agmatinase